MIVLIRIMMVIIIMVIIMMIMIILIIVIMIIIAIIHKSHTRPGTEGRDVRACASCDIHTHTVRNIKRQTTKGIFRSSSDSARVAVGFPPSMKTNKHQTLYMANRLLDMYCFKIWVYLTTCSTLESCQSFYPTASRGIQPFQPVPLPPEVLRTSYCAHICSTQFGMSVLGQSPNLHY